MARIFTDGAESGDTSTLENILTGALPNINTSNPRTGIYTYNCPGTYEAYWSIGEVDEIYFRFAKMYGSFAPHDFYARDVNNVSFISLRWSQTTRIYSAYVDGVSVAEGTKYIPSDGEYYLIEGHFKLDATVGKIELKVNGTLDISYTGDTTVGTVESTFNQLRTMFKDTNFDDIAINDTTGTEDNSWCGDGHIILYKPNASGSTTMLMGSDGDQTDNYALVDDIPSDGDTSYVYSGSAGYYDLYKLEDTALPVNSVIKRVWVESRAKDPDTGYLNSVIQTASGSYTSGSVQLTTAYSAQKYDEYTTNPDTGVAWTFDEIDNLQAGIQIAE